MEYNKKLRYIIFESYNDGFTDRRSVVDIFYYTITTNYSWRKLRKTMQQYLDRGASEIAVEDPLTPHVAGQDITKTFTK